MIVGRVRKILDMIARGKRLPEICQVLGMEENHLKAILDSMAEEGLLQEVRARGCAGCPLNCGRSARVYGYAITATGRERMKP